MNTTKRLAVLAFRVLMVVLALLAGSGLMAWSFIDMDEEDDE